MTNLRKRPIETECIFAATRSSGPGGQNVNKVNSRVELRFAPSRSNFLTDDEKQLIIRKLAHKLTAEGELIVTCQEGRSQFANRALALEKMLAMLEIALIKPKLRIATRPPKGATEKRLGKKQLISDRKELRRKPDW